MIRPETRQAVAVALVVLILTFGVMYTAIAGKANLAASIIVLFGYPMTVAFAAIALVSRPQTPR